MFFEYWLNGFQINPSMDVIYVSLIDGLASLIHLDSSNYCIQGIRNILWSYNPLLFFKRAMFLINPSYLALLIADFEKMEV